MEIHPVGVVGADTMGNGIAPVFALMEGVGSRAAIDTVMRLGMNHPVGPLTLAARAGGGALR